MAYLCVYNHTKECDGCQKCYEDENPYEQALDYDYYKDNEF